MHVKTDKPPSPRMERTIGNGQVHLPGPGHPAKTPDIRPLEMPPQQPQPSQKSYRARTSGPAPRTSGLPGSSGNPALCPEILPRLSRDRRSLRRQLGHLAPQPRHPATPEAPDIWPDARTSGLACL